MTDLFVLANQISTPVKIAWLLWLAWVVVQAASYRWARAAVPAVEEPVAATALDRNGIEQVRESSSNPTSELPNPKYDSGPTAGGRRRRRHRPPSTAAHEASEPIESGVEETISMG
jgi:hypothetical protein